MTRLATFFFLLLFSVLCALPAPAQGPQGPQATLKQGVDKLIAILDDPVYKDKSRDTEKVEKLRQTISEYFDFQELSMRAVGKPWLKFTDKQKDDLVDAFSDLLEKTYLGRIGKYDKEKVEYLQELIEGDKAFIKTMIVAKDKQISVDYRMVKKDRWMVYDVIGEGVSLVKNYRTQFAGILHSGTPDVLIQRIRDKVKDIDEGRADPTKDDIFEAKKESS
ncbi:MAG: ABC transporter substrate-binding protein [Desulfovibrionaceae bacterium]|nr:ABC transporter substrate-binding protein [Desulfovibrionaceae bacterium]